MRYIILAILILAPLTALAHSEIASVQIVDSQIQDHYKSDLFRTKVKERLQVRAIVNGERVLLECATYDCERLSAGIYSAEIHKSRVRIGYVAPLTHKYRHESFRAIGTWGDTSK